MHNDAELVKSLIEGRFQLFELVCQFNYNVAEYVHPSHLEGIINKELLDVISKDRTARTDMAKILLTRFELNDSPCFDFTSPRTRLALISEVTLQKLYFYVGAALLHERITRIISKDALNQLREQLGKNVYFFAIKRAPFLVSEKPKLESLETSSPDVFIDLIRVAGECIACCLSGEPVSVTRRFALKFPKKLAWHFEKKYSEEERAAAWAFVHRILIKEVGPTWKSCFT
jgi:hypothetical protein